MAFTVRNSIIDSRGSWTTAATTWTLPTTGTGTTSNALVAGDPLFFWLTTGGSGNTFSSVTSGWTKVIDVTSNNSQGIIWSRDGGFHAGDTTFGWTANQNQDGRGGFFALSGSQTSGFVWGSTNSRGSSSTTLVVPDSGAATNMDVLAIAFEKTTNQTTCTTSSAATLTLQQQAFPLSGKSGSFTMVSFTATSSADDVTFSYGLTGNLNAGGLMVILNPIGTASQTITVSSSATGGGSGSADQTVTASSSASGSATGTAAQTVTATGSASGGTSGTADQTVTADTSAAGGTSGSAAETVTTSTSADGGTVGTADQTVTASTSAFGVVISGFAGTASATVTASTTADGGTAGIADLVATVDTSADGFASSSGAADLVVPVDTLADGFVGLFATAGLLVTVGTSADGSVFVPTPPRDLTFTESFGVAGFDDLIGVAGYTDIIGEG